MKVIFYSTHCPRCNVLETKLKQKGIEFIENNDVEEMKALGLQSAPALKVEDKVMDFGDAIHWINQQGV